MAPSWKLTVRDGSEVSHEGFEDLGEAVGAMRRRALAIRAEGLVKPLFDLVRETLEGDD